MTKNIVLPETAQTLLLSNKVKDPKWVEQFAENRWLGLGDITEIKTQNPFDNMTDFERENPHVFLLDLMRRPELFGFTCRVLFNKYSRIAPFQIAILQELWKRPFPMLIGSRGLGKSFILALYSMLRALFEQGRRIVIVGSAFRQAKVVFDYCVELFSDSPVLRSIIGNNKANGPKRDVDRCSMRLGESLIVALPLGTGEKIRGQRASIVISDEFGSIPVDIFETVVRGFGAVSMAPVEKMINEYRKVAYKELGVWTEVHEDLHAGNIRSNQTIISGTATYSFKAFYQYWQRYKAIVESRGDERKLKEVFNGAVPENFNWRDYSVIRIPFDRLPPGFMDEKQIAQAKATIHSGIYLMEYGATFCADSNGFYKRSLIESCVVGKPDHEIEKACGVVRFHAVLKGRPNRRYVIAVDPASEIDNFSVVVLELWEDHRRVVHCWTTSKERYKQKVKRGLTQEHDFYAYCARKIRELMLDFPAERIAIDNQGGGVAVIEALQAKDRLKPGERPLYPAIDPLDPKSTDGLDGDHLIDVIEFARSEWVSRANHGMRKDFEDKTLLFPEFNSAVLGLAIEEDKATKRVQVDPNDGTLEKLYDTLDDCFMEIEELKDELATIVISQTPSGNRDRWDTPETKSESGKKGRLRKDRYSALLMANMSARILAATPRPQEYMGIGDFVHNRSASPADRKDGPMWYSAKNSAWAEKANKAGSLYGGGQLLRRDR